MTDEQLECARKHVEWHRERFGYKAANTDFKVGLIEDLAGASGGGVKSSTMDVVISNCVLNLAPDKLPVRDWAAVYCSCTATPTATFRPPTHSLPRSPSLRSSRRSAASSSPAASCTSRTCTRIGGCPRRPWPTRRPSASASAGPCTPTTLPARCARPGSLRAWCRRSLRSLLPLLLPPPVDSPPFLLLLLLCFPPSLFPSLSPPPPTLQVHGGDAPRHRRERPGLA